MSAAPEPRAASEWAALDAALDAALAPWWGEPRPISLLFSGGVDSSLLALELGRRRAVELVTIGLAGSHDLAAAESAAGALGLPWTPRPVSLEELRSWARRRAPLLGDLPATPRAVLVGLGLAVEAASHPVVLVGQGPDELFLGYAHFRELTGTAALARVGDDLRVARELWARLEAIVGGPNRSIAAPYLSPPFVAAASAVPVDRRREGGVPKGLFRRFAVHRGLPEALAARPKRAFQYGSGVDRALRPPARPPR